MEKFALPLLLNLGKDLNPSHKEELSNQIDCIIHNLENEKIEKECSSGENYELLHIIEEANDYISAVLTRLK